MFYTVLDMEQVLIKVYLRGSSDVLVVKNTDSSSRGSGFDPQHADGSLRPSVMLLLSM